MERFKIGRMKGMSLEDVMPLGVSVLSPRGRERPNLMVFFKNVLKMTFNSPLVFVASFLECIDSIL